MSDSGPAEYIQTIGEDIMHSQLQFALVNIEQERSQRVSQEPAERRKRRRSRESNEGRMVESLIGRWKL